MLKINTKNSIFLSICFSIIFFIFCVAFSFVLPYFVNYILHLPRITIVNKTDLIFIYVLGYTVIAVMMFADIKLYKLLKRVRKNQIFTDKSVSLIRGVSWCCIILCFLFFLLGIYFRLAFIVSLVAVFLGLCLRVVKNVIEQAVEIKSENDLTV